MNRIPSSKDTNSSYFQGGKEIVEVDIMSSPTDWRDSCFTIKDKLYNSLISGCFSDIRFTVGQIHKKEIPAHRFILYLNSPVFETLLEGSHLNKPVNVTVSDVEPEAFISFLKFLYTDEFDVHVKDATAVLYLSKKYDIPRLSLLCAEFVKGNISTKNVVSVLLSAEALGESSISIQARQFLRRNIRYVIHEEDFLHLNAEELCQMFASDELVVSELELFNAAVHWAIEECKREKLEASPQNYRFVLKSVLPLIRFPLMDRKEFTLHVATKNILTDSECLNILMHWDVSPKERASLPPLLFSNKPRREQSKNIPDTVVSLSHQTATKEQQQREFYDSSYYYDAKAQQQQPQGFRTPQQNRSKPPPPPRRNTSSTPNWPQNQQPFTYLSDNLNIPNYGVNYVDYGRY